MGKPRAGVAGREHIAIRQLCISVWLQGNGAGGAKGGEERERNGFVGLLRRRSAQTCPVVIDMARLHRGLRKAKVKLNARGPMFATDWVLIFISGGARWCNGKLRSFHNIFGKTAFRIYQDIMFIFKEVNAVKKIDMSSPRTQLVAPCCKGLLWYGVV